MIEKQRKADLKGHSSLTPPKDPIAEDFRNFLFVVWQFLGLPEPTEVQYDIAKYLQHGPKRAIVEAFRGVGKSWITVAFVCWLLYRNRDIKVLVVSANAQKANEFSTFALRLIREMPLLKHLSPGPEQRTSMVAFDVAGCKPDQSPSVKSVGITGQITGSRADVIVPDDIEVPHNSDTQGKRDKLLEQVKEFDAVIKPGGRIVYLGTPQTEQSIYNVLPERGYVTRIWPALYPADINRYGMKLAPLIKDKLEADPSLQGKPTDPQRFTEIDLSERSLSYGRSGFALQFMLDTSLSDADKHPLKLSDLIVWPLDPLRGPTDLVWASSPDLVANDLPNVGLPGDRYHRPAWISPEFAPYEGAIMFVDPSGRGKDETAYAVVKLLHGRLFLTASGGFLGGYDDKTLKAILEVAKKQSVGKILVEPNFGGGMFTRLLQSAAQDVVGVSIQDAEWSSVSKEQRIVDTLEPVLNQHRLVVCPSVIEADFNSVKSRDGERVPFYRLFFQMTRMVREKGALAQDDRLDALAGAVAYWTKHLSRDTHKAALEYREAQFEAQLEKFLNGMVLGGEPRQSATFASSTLKSIQRRH